MDLKQKIKDAKNREKDWVSSARAYISVGDYDEACSALVSANAQRFLAQELKCLLTNK